MSVRRRCTRLAMFLVGALCLAACERPGASLAGESGSEPAAAAPAATPTAAAASGGPLPAEGKVFAAVGEAGVTALANQAARVDLLRALADEAGFTLVLGRIRRAEPLTYRAEQRPLEAVLAELLVGLPYELSYEPRSDAEGGLAPPAGANVLASVTVGRFKSPLRRAQRQRQAAAREREDSKAPGRARPVAPTPEERARRAEERQASRVQALETLDASGDAAARADAVRWLRPEGEELGRLAQLATEDPAPAVRAAAADQLAGEDSTLAVNTLLRALGDPDPEVVIAALDALEFAGDETLASDIRPLLEHPDPEVREAAADAIDFLQ